MKAKISLASDNFAGVHPDVMQALIQANAGPAPAYGNDDYTSRAVMTFQTVFGQDTEVFFVFNGTGANVTALGAMNRSFHAVICSDLAHIQVDECGAPEKFTGCKLLLVPNQHGKLSPQSIEKHLLRVGDQHHVQPGVISISQTTEYGTVYSIGEIRALADFAHQHKMFLHVDGARICNAAASLKSSLRACTRDAGVDVLSFGGTKNGMMFGEAVVFFNRELARDFLFIRKQGMQLASKMRFISAQFLAMFADELWLRNATHANAMAALLADKLKQLPQVKITRSVDSNAVFAIIPPHIVTPLQEKSYFYIWNESLSEARLMTAFNTTPEEIDSFVNYLKELL